MIVLNNTGNKKSFLLFLFKVQTSIQFPCLDGGIFEFFTFVIKTFFSPMAWINPSFPFPLLSSLSVHLLFSHLSLLPALLPGLSPDLLPAYFLLSILTCCQLTILILILPVRFIFSGWCSALTWCTPSAHWMWSHWLRVFLPCFPERRSQGSH